MDCGSCCREFMLFSISVCALLGPGGRLLWLLLLPLQLLGTTAACAAAAGCWALDLSGHVVAACTAAALWLLLDMEQSAVSSATIHTDISRHVWLAVQQLQQAGMGSRGRQWHCCCGIAAAGASTLSTGFLCSRPWRRAITGLPHTQQSTALASSFTALAPHEGSSTPMQVQLMTISRPAGLHLTHNGSCRCHILRRHALRVN